MSPARQVRAGIVDAGKNVGPGGFFARFAATARLDGRELPVR